MTVDFVAEMWPAFLQPLMTQRNFAPISSKTPSMGSGLVSRDGFGACDDCDARDDTHEKYSNRGFRGVGFGTAMVSGADGAGS
jgi:hypothetical protein